MFSNPALRPPRRETRARGVPTWLQARLVSEPPTILPREAAMRRSAHAGLIAAALLTLTFAALAHADDFTATPPGGHWK